MSNMTPADPNGPLMRAWNAYKLTVDYLNTLSWATKPEHTEGSLWAAFEQGFSRAGAAPVLPEPGLSLNIQRDPLAISELLDDSRQRCERVDRILLETIQAIAVLIGDEAWRVPSTELPTVILERLQLKEPV